MYAVMAWCLRLSITLSLSLLVPLLVSLSSLQVTLCNFEIKYLYLVYPPYYAIILFDLLLGD